MALSESPTIDLLQLQQAVQGADPSVLLVEARILRRIIKADRHLVGIGLQVPHGKSYVISRAGLLQIITADELGLPPGWELPPTVVLLAYPASDEMRILGRDLLLLQYWRRLFHAYVHRALEKRVAQGRLTNAVVRHRIQALGATEFDAARAVLRQENYLLPPRDDRSVYVEFAAVYLELRHLAPQLLPDYFPGLGDCKHIDALLGEDMDVAALLSQSRPLGAAEPACQPGGEQKTLPGPVEAAPPEHPSGRAFRFFVARADRARATGNVVRAALWRMRAAGVASAGVVRAPAARPVPNWGPWSTACGWPSIFLRSRSLSGTNPCRPCCRAPRGASGRWKHGCCTTCRKCASITNGTSTRSIWWNGSAPWDAGRSSVRSPNNAKCCG